MKKKSIIITIIVIFLVLILAGGIFAYIFFCTDLLLSEKQGFGKYALQLVDTEDGFISNSINEYIMKKENTPYNTNGKINANIEILKDISDNYIFQGYDKAVEFGNNTNITFTGKVDNEKAQMEQNVTVNYTNKVKITFKFKVYEDIYGIQSDSISKPYIAIENNNLQELSQKFGIEYANNIPNRIETTKKLESLKLTEEEKTHIQNEYILPIYNNIDEQKFSKTKDTDGSVTYTLTLSSSELKNIYIDILETLKRDQTMINKINSVMQEIYSEKYNETYKITSEDIQEEIDYITKQEWEDDTLKINITQHDKETNKINVTYQDTIFDITKNETETDITYKILLNETENETEKKNIVALTLRFSGLNTNSITENYIINIKSEEEFDITYTYNDTVSFDENISIEPLTTANAAILNNYSAEQIQRFIMQLGIKIDEINKEQMTNLGYNLQYSNPLVTWISTPSYIRRVSFLEDMDQINQKVEEELEQEKQQMIEYQEHVNSLLSEYNSETTVE